MTHLKSIETDYRSIQNYLTQTGQPSFASDVNRYFKKIFVLAAASLFEHQLTSILMEMASTLSNGDERLVYFLKRQAISQRYHQLFDWGETDNPEIPGRSGKHFFRLFGDDFHKAVQHDLAAKPEIQSALEDFLEIGHLRNILVHNNFAIYEIDTLTSEEILAKSENATGFVTYIKAKLLITPSGEGK